MTAWATECVEVLDSQPSWILENPPVWRAVTQRGGHMATVTFVCDNDAPVRPDHVSPRHNEGITELPTPVLECLRGDWLGIRFGGDGTE